MREAIVVIREGFSYLVLPFRPAEYSVGAYGGLVETRASQKEYTVAKRAVGSTTILDAETGAQIYEGMSLEEFADALGYRVVTQKNTEKDTEATCNAGWISTANW